ncbi:protein Rcr1p [[Candida] jaroonii]|uniref:Protein Rcr1p n=1 Tax=[Candida] jaroonii TaxID=467808 RepID=A0ACA9Y3U0_9ASCO|nr:protein Rcr1p [[Candida] jaroonii]
MAAINLVEIGKRDLWSNNDGARWALFAIFILIILIVIGGTLKVNKKRTTNGLQPIYGTRWMTPPSYNQSQTQYDQPANGGGDVPTNYVPTYTERANDQDMGYYDNNGEFHPNPNVKNFQSHNDSSFVAHPPESHNRSYSTSNGVALDDLDEDLTRPTFRSNDVSPPAGPPPNVEPSHAANQTTNPSEHTATPSRN